MENGVTKEDLQHFGAALIGTIRKLIEAGKDNGKEAVHPEWLKSRVVREAPRHLGGITAEPEDYGTSPV